MVQFGNPRSEESRAVYITKLMNKYTNKNKKEPDKFLIAQWRLMPLQRLKLELEKYSGKT
jgi:hypothetical protein